MPLSERAKNILSFLNGFRKFIVMLLLVVVAVLFRLTNYLSGAEMVDLLRYTAVAFMGANTVEHVMNGVRDWIQGKTEIELTKNLES